jgi:hypothetical protein
MTFTLDPNGNLEGLTTEYKLKITSGAQDVAGNALTEVIVTFTTP